MIVTEADTYADRSVMQCTSRIQRWQERLYALPDVQAFFRKMRRQHQWGRLPYALAEEVPAYRILAGRRKGGRQS
jgi:hypothetical protein